jgi:hypothetical protein
METKMTDDDFTRVDGEGLTYFAEGEKRTMERVKQFQSELIDYLLVLSDAAREVSGQQPSADALCITGAFLITRGGTNE